MESITVPRCAPPLLASSRRLGRAHPLNAPDGGGNFTPNCGGFLPPLIRQLIGSQIGSICRSRTMHFDEDVCAPLEIAIGRHRV